jgi:hypothetical protein
LLAPLYEYQRALIYAPADNRFSVHRWEVRVKARLFFGLSRRAYGQ